MRIDVRSKNRAMAVAATALSALAVTPPAHATDACAEGQTITPDTAGHCCWPGQAWSNSRSICVGVPACPSGTTVAGDSCIAAASATTCPPGQSIGADTAGHCCWSAQVWSASRNACVGIPQCPPGLSPNGEQCSVACPPGQSIGADTAGHCCWPSQVWSSSRNQCVGIPACPSGTAPSGEACAPVSTAQGVPAPPTAYVSPVYAPATNATVLQASPATSTVRIVGAHDRHYTVQIVSQNESRSCSSPCTMTVPAGSASVTTTENTRSFTRSVVLPPGPVALQVGVRRDLAFPITMIILGLLEDSFGLFMVASPGIFGRDASLGWVFVGASAVNYVIGAIGLATMGSNRIEVGGPPMPVSALDRVHFGAGPLPGGGAIGSFAVRF